MPAVAELTVSVEVAFPPLDRVMLEGLREAVRPVGVTAVDRLTVPLNPNRLEAVIVDVPVEPAGTVRVAGFAVTAKLGGFNGLSLRNLMLVGAEVP